MGRSTHRQQFSSMAATEVDEITISSLANIDKSVYVMSFPVSVQRQWLYHGLYKG